MTQPSASSEASPSPDARPAPKPSAWMPLRIALFRGLWIAALVSNIGSAMHGVGASWLITSLSPSAAVIATLQSAIALPSFLLALPAGAFADVFDRRRLLIGAQALMLIAAALLGVLTLSHRITTTGLLLLSVLLSIGGTINMPNWIAITPEIVGRDQLLAASSLNSVSMNLSMAVGPAVAGLLIARLGVGWVFVANAISFVGVILVVARWKRERAASTLPAEHVGAAIRTGLRYVRNEPNIATVLTRLAGVMVFAAANGALMPVLARQRVKVTAGQFGILTTATGVGAVVTALLLPKIRGRVGPDVIANVGGFLLAAALFMLGRTTALVPFTVVLVVAGAAQLCIFSTVFSTAQAVLPNWVRGRGLAIAMLVVQGVTFAASLGWGALMSSSGAPFTLGAAGIGLAIVTALMLPLKLRGRADVDLSPAEAVWPHPHTALGVEAGRGPVLVKVTYPINPEAKQLFVTAMNDVRRARRRNGAMSWGLFDDVEQPDHLVETFKFATWAEHEREQQRRTATDAALHAAARTHLQPGTKPATVHYLGVRTTAEHHLARSLRPVTPGEIG